MWFYSFFFSEKKCLACYDHYGYDADISVGDIWSYHLKNNPIKHTALVIKNEKNKGNEFKRALYRPWLRYIDKAGGQKMYAIMEEGKLVKLFGNFLATVKTAI